MHDPSHEERDRPERGAESSMAARMRPLKRWESLAEQRIREAEAAGQFDHLSGLGAPIPGIDEPLDENWWVKRKLREEGISIVPPALEARRERERTLEQIVQLDDEADVRERLSHLNAKLLAALHSPVRGPVDGVLLVDIEREIERWREARSARTGDAAG